MLITGASIASNALAWWLSRCGFVVTVVEHHLQFREGGQNIDVRGAGREVLKNKRLERAVANGGTGARRLALREIPGGGYDNDEGTMPSVGVQETSSLLRSLVASPDTEQTSSSSHPASIADAISSACFCSSEA